MEYDKKIDDKDMILNCLDVDFARNKYENSYGYFTDDIQNYSNLNKCGYGKLITIGNSDIPYKAENNQYFRFFLPDCAIKKEKKYRPYTLMEFTEKFTTGRPIKFRRKGMEGCERYLILNGYIHEQYSDQPTTYIYIGANVYTLQELFDEYEWQVHYTEDFEPFGVVEE